MAKPNLFRHHKLRHLSRLLKPLNVGPCPRLVAIGLLESLWHEGYAVPSAFLGCADDVEDAVRWNGEPGALCDALVSAGFLDEVVGGYVIHDWLDHLPDFARKKVNRLKKMASSPERPEPTPPEPSPPAPEPSPPAPLPGGEGSQNVGAHGGAPSASDPVSAVCPPHGGRTADLVLSCSALSCSELTCTEKAAAAATRSAPEAAAAACVDEEEIQFGLAVERAFQELGGSAVPLAPRDATAVKSWYEAGVDFETVWRCFREKASSSGLTDAHGRPIRTLRYFHDVVHEAHRKILRFRGPWADPRTPAIVPTIDVAARLAALAAALPPELPDRETWSRQVVELEGGVEEVEERLKAVDRQVLDAAAAMLGARDRQELEEQLAKAVAHLGRRHLPAEQLRKTEQLLRERLLREKLSLPVLSLFSPEAVERPLQEVAA